MEHILFPCNFQLYAASLRSRISTLVPFIHKYCKKICFSSFLPRKLNESSFFFFFVLYKFVSRVALNYHFYIKRFFFSPKIHTTPRKRFYRRRQLLILKTTFRYDRHIFLFFFFFQSQNVNYY